MVNVTKILSHIEHGDPAAAGQLLVVVYDELRRLAAQMMAHEKPGQTLDATGLVHEAYLRLFDGDCQGEGERQHWDGRGISLLLRPKPCGGFSLKMHAAKTESSTGAINGVDLLEQDLAVQDAHRQTPGVG